MASEEDGNGEIDVDARLSDPAEQKESEHNPEPDAEAPPPDEPGGPDAGPGGQAPSAVCSRRFTAIHDSGTRNESAIKLIVIHSTEGDTATGAATWFESKDRRNKGSAHLVVDDRECFRTLENNVIPWGAKGANTNGFHIEHAGHAKEWDRQKWMSHEGTLRRGAFKAALHARKFDIPLRLLSADDLRRGRSGFVTHVTVTQVFGGTHTDPGPGFPLDHYMDLVKRFAQEMDT
jgi:hypothetical protein